jgi:hypothetical protein
LLQPDIATAGESEPDRAGGAIMSQTLYSKHEPWCLVNIIFLLTSQTVPPVLNRFRSFSSASLWQEVLLDPFLLSAETFRDFHLFL